MVGREPIAPLFARKCAGVVEGEPKRRRVRLEQDVGNTDLALQIGPLAGVSRVFVIADIVPRPAVERAFAPARNVVGHQIVPKTVALIGRAIDVPAYRMNRKTDAIADAAGKEARVFSLGIEHQHISAVGLASPGRAERMRVIPRRQSPWRASDPFLVIAGGAEPYQQPLAVAAKHDVSGHVSAAMP